MHEYAKKKKSRTRRAAWFHGHSHALSLYKYLYINIYCLLSLQKYLYIDTKYIIFILDTYTMRKNAKMKKSARLDLTTTSPWF